MDLEATVRELAPQLLRYALGQTGDAALAEEVAQDALTALVQRWRRHGPPDCPAAFAFAVAKRRAFRAGLQRRLLQPIQVLFEGASPLPGPEELAAGRTDLGHTLAAMRRLPGKDREALLLVAEGDLGLAESARVLGISLSALKMRVHRARKRLAQLLVAGLAAMALLFAWQLGRVRFQPAAISIVNEGGVLIATSPSGDWLVRSAEPRPEEPETPGIIIVSYGGTEK
ncbi:MAG: sigma-70 family RNA polymerase sigma factor [Acidobacteriota bacterium]